MAGGTQAEKVAVLTQRMNDHEASCNARMQEIRDTFKEVKDVNKSTHTFVIAQMVTLLGGALAILAAIAFKKIGLM